MMCAECGCALILVYDNGSLTSVLAHRHDGGEAYMGPLLRRGVAYAKTHYDSGNIVDILLSETEMERLDCDVTDFAEDNDVRHVYYVSYRWDARSGKKIYAVSCLHFCDGKRCDFFFPNLADTPRTAKRLI